MRCSKVKSVGAKTRTVSVLTYYVPSYTPTSTYVIVGTDKLR